MVTVRLLLVLAVGSTWAEALRLRAADDGLERNFRWEGAEESLYVHPVFAMLMDDARNVGSNETLVTLAEQIKQMKRNERIWEQWEHDDEESWMISTATSSGRRDHVSEPKAKAPPAEVYVAAPTQKPKSAISVQKYHDDGEAWKRAISAQKEHDEEEPWMRATASSSGRQDDFPEPEAGESPAEIHVAAPTRIRKSGISAHVYVINLMKRHDRWQCMQAQLNSTQVPFSYTRFAASEPKTYKKECPYLKHSDMAQGEAAESVMCSNYRIWKEAQEKDSEWVIVLEDDVVMAPGVWERVSDLLAGNCQSSFDFLAVDTFTGHGDTREQARPFKHEDPVCHDENAGIALHALRGVGAHMQIFHRDALGDIIKVAEKKDNIDHPVDQLTKKLPSRGLRTAMFQAEIAAQYQSAKVQGLHKPSHELCKESVGHSDIH